MSWLDGSATPEEGKDQNEYVWGDTGDYGQDLNEQAIRDNLRAPALGGFERSQSEFAGIFNLIFNQIGQVLADIITGIANGVIQVGGAIAGAIGSVAEGIVNLIDNIAGAILGGGSRADSLNLPSIFSGSLGVIASAQELLNNRLELMEDIAGYANATIPNSFRMSTGGQPSSVNSGTLFNFSKQIGPVKNARVSGSGIQFDKHGTWRIDAQVMNSGTVTSLFGGQPRAVFDIQVWGRGGNPNSLITRKYYTEEIPNKRLTATWNTTVVLPPEWFTGANKPYVVVRGWHGFNNTISMAHGEGSTSLSVNRWDVDTSGPLNTVPPNEADV